MFTVGSLYSCQEFLAFIGQERIAIKEFSSSRTPFGVVKASDVVTLAIRCGWTRLNEDGICELTDKGLAVKREPNEPTRLRKQILDYVDIEQPIWSAKSCWGRSESCRLFPEPVQQVFREAGLLEDWTDELITWWDSFALKVRGIRSEKLLETGRRAERKSMEYELKRTGVKPIWKSLDTDYAGYDIRSIDGDKPIYIEVKGTELRFKEAQFKVSRHECDVASELDGYRFHLWVLREPARLFAFTATEILEHLPHDKADGKWDLVKIPMKSFLAHERVV